MANAFDEKDIVRVNDILSDDLARGDTAQNSRPPGTTARSCGQQRLSKYVDMQNK